jgi:hypothetical protein
MPRRPLHLAAVFALAPLLLSQAQSIAQFDSIVDFQTGLNEIGRLLVDGRPQAVDRSRLYILTGTVSDVLPKASWFFALRAQEIVDPAAFVTEIRRGSNALSLYLRKSLTEPVSRLVDAYVPGTRPSAQTVDAVLKDLNDQIRKGGPMASGVATSLKLSAPLRKLLSVTEADDDEKGYLSRLLLEEGFAGLIAPVEVTLEMVSGEWVGTETVRSYHALLILTGPESYKAFVRRRTLESGTSIITVGSRVAAVVKIEDAIELPGKTPAWLAECLRIRSIR